jgi:membrane protein YdbS with pleckstrin-like domain
MADTTTDAEPVAPAAADYEPPEWLSLDADEEIQWMGEPVPVSIVGTAVWGLLLTVVLIGVLLLLTLPLSYLSLKNTDYVVTNKTLYVKTGVASTSIESVGLDRIQNTEFSQSFWGKQFGYGSMDVSTAGSSGAEISFNSIPDAREVRELVTSLSNDYTGGRQSGGRSDRATGGGEAAGTGADGMDELVEELRATREAMERVERLLSGDAEAVGRPDGSERAGETHRSGGADGGRDSHGPVDETRSN